MAGSPDAILSSEAEVADAGVLRVVARDTADGCTAGDVGVYQWSLTAGDTLLRLSATSDACASRRAAFDGDWERSACANNENLCLGDLDAGTYRSQYIGPRLNDGQAWTANLGALSYTVPDGWSNSYDFPDAYVLMPSDEYATASDPRDGTKDLIEVYTRPAAAIQDSTCEPRVKPGVGRSVNELIAYLTHHPDLTVSDPQRITAGHSGQYVDVKISPSSTARCPDFDGTLVVVFTEAGPDVTNSGTEQWVLTGTGKARLIVLDLGKGDVVLIDIRAPDSTSFDALVPGAMPIVESFRFN
jgi:hypothetical protein